MPRSIVVRFGLVCCILTFGFWEQASVADDPNVEAKPSSPTKEKEAPPDDADPFPNRPKAPSFDGGIAWLNSAGPIELSKLKGKVILLDFWTYCCINCMHILPDLAKLEAEFPDELVVVGVHSAKFEGEQDTDNIRDAILRYDIKHPVVNDGKMIIWRRYGVNSWPTQVLIDPSGRYLGHVSGEGNYDVVRDVIQKVIKYHEKKGTLDRRPIHFMQESLGQERTPLFYPGKILVDEPTQRLFIADSGHHRIVLADATTGQIIDLIGRGEPGHQDGLFDEASFFEPQGMALVRGKLFVADRKNHLIRAVDLDAKRVTTIAGTGTQGHERSGSGPAREIPLASPWDLLARGDELFIAMAGTHQIWRLNLTSNELSPYAGNGRENILDGDGPKANFAQPSGLAADDTHLYVADSETSSIRKIRWSDGAVETVIGAGLFDFGDVDGLPKKARLQHALGVDVSGDQLFVADTYNNKIKSILLSNGLTETYLGDGQGALADDPPRFDEPGDVQVVGPLLYVADTNNHAIRVINRDTKKVATLRLPGLEAPAVADETESAEGEPKKEPPVVVAKNKNIVFEARVSVPEGQKLNPKAPMSYSLWTMLEGKPFSRIARGRIEKIDSAVTISCDASKLEGASSLRLSITYFPCDIASEGVCRIATQAWQMPVSLSDQGVDHVELNP
ncbi:redoxin domain-containing protein [bacterium]|nr:redoxin domain-containing protein [bacterium]